LDFYPLEEKIYRKENPAGGFLLVNPDKWEYNDWNQRDKKLPLRGSWQGVSPD
jgi:hypothetical protein